MRDRFSHSKKLKAKLTKERKESGGDMAEGCEMEKLLEELIKLNDEAENKSEEQSESKRETAEKEKCQALEMRKRAMEMLGQSRKRSEDKEDEPVKTEKRRSGGDTLEWLKERAGADREMKEMEMNEKKKERETQISLQQQMMQQQQQQFAMLQQQMLAVIQQHQQQTQALFNLLQKSNRLIINTKKFHYFLSGIAF